MTQGRPSSADVRAAAGRTIPDVIAPGLDILFCGINPGLYSAATGFHFARPGNRFWPALAAAGFTATTLAPDQGRRLLVNRIGITNLVARATASADELHDDELRAGRRRLEAKVRRYRPRAVAIVGIGAYRHGLRTSNCVNRAPARGPGGRDTLGAPQHQRLERPLSGRRFREGLCRAAPRARTA